MEQRNIHRRTQFRTKPNNALCLFDENTAVSPMQPHDGGCAIVAKKERKKQKTSISAVALCSANFRFIFSTSMTPIYSSSVVIVSVMRRASPWPTSSAMSARMAPEGYTSLYAAE